MRKIFLLFTAFAFAAMMTGCNNDSGENTYYPNYLMTVKTDTTSGQCYLQLDNNTTALPTNVKTNPYGKQVRALGYINEIEPMVGLCNKSCHVCWMDSLLTKKSVAPKDTSVWGGGYGKDAVDILNTWVTILEDNYLTLAFNAYYTVSGHVHTMNLVYLNDSNPYEVMFTHDAHESAEVTYGASFSGTVAFDLRQIPNLMKEDSATVIVHYKSPVGYKSVSFRYPLSQPYSSSDRVGAVSTETVR